MNTITTQLPFKGVMTSYIGGRKENQDTCGYSDTSRGLLLVVCDGMGGGPGGKTASSIAATSIIAYVQQAGGQPENEKINNETLLRDAVVAANRALRDKIAESPELSGMGTTVTAVLITASSASLAHVGDSRIYQLRRGKIVFRTADHSRVGEMVRAGALTDEQARLSAISNLITRALGIGDEVEVDTTSLAFEKGDRFVLCTDGVWGSMPQPDLVKSLTENKSLENTAVLLNVKVENAGLEKGGHHDNYTMIIAETTSSSAVAAKNDAKAKATVGINDETAKVIA
ncbi:MAG: protein phosphatase 2C domain-containing protein, partial [Muribaculaceae bacterium]|nr:protein phosphatase 2C domain-containing protein [Muribaculaceae bacterium]